MHRIIITLGPFTVYSYGLMLALAFVIGTYLAHMRAKAAGLKPDKLTDLIFYILVFSLVGARLFFVAVNFEYYKSHLFDIFKVWEGGLVFYGGLIFGFCAAAWFSKKHKISFWKTLDILSPSLALGIVLGRIGCFLNGCCYGKLARWWGVCFPGAENPPAFSQQVFDGLISPVARYSLPVIPTQVYDALANLIVFCVLLVLEKQKRFDGFLFLVFIILYSINRFVIESYRYYEQNFVVFNSITISQLISIILAVSAAVLLFKRRT
ncbi:MAG: prolipoprotein diacylglyceryl transferase [Candidatus Omnitrophota bacterium]|jgi:phosphatidylglycerol:prolipoprotein diacylglycerol transferase